MAVSAGFVNPGGEYFVRSHFVSRGWASVGLAITLSRLALSRRFRGGAATIFAVFIFFGVWGGVERQSYLLGYSINERRELSSLLEAVPAFAPSTRLLVIQPPGSPLMAVNNPNVVPFLYGNAGLWNSVILAPNSPLEASTVDGDASGRIVIATLSKGTAVVDPSACIMVFYSKSQRRFVRLDESPAGLLRGSDSFVNTYRPGRFLFDQMSTTTTPRAVTEFLAQNGFVSAAKRKRHFSRTPSVLTISADLANLVQVDSLTPYAIGKYRGVDVAWLGPNRSAGYSSLIWAQADVLSRLHIEVSALPDRRPIQLPLVTRLIRPDGTDDLMTYDFEGRGVFKRDLRLATGANTFELWLQVADAALLTGDALSRLAYVAQMRITTADGGN